MKKYIIPALGAIILIIAVWIAFGSNKSAESPNLKELNTPAATEPASANTVIILADRYEPSSLTVKKGEKVTFINRDSDDHWPASDNHPSHQIYSQFDPKRPIPEGESWEFVFDREGQWQYHDHLFPSIEGMITVKP